MSVALCCYNMKLPVCLRVNRLLRITSFRPSFSAGVFIMLESILCGFVHGSDITHVPPEYEVVHPHRVDSSGHFLSSDVSFHVSRVQRRETREFGKLAQVFYQLQYGGHYLHFNLTLNPHLVAPGLVTEKRDGGLHGSKVHRPRHSLCYFLGGVSQDSVEKGQASLSTCDGLTGLFKLAEDEYFIRPLDSAKAEASLQAHIIYKHKASEAKMRQQASILNSVGNFTLNHSCGFKDQSRTPERWQRQRERWERRQQRRRIHERSISREKWVETLVVADPKMVEYHGSKRVESYILAVMNIVAGLFRDASIGNAINIAVVRIILLEKDEEDLKISHHADHSLNSFCKWQKRLNMKGDEHPVHHDVAILLTRKDICASINKPCETLGLSHVAGLCQPHRSCSISEDTGLPVAFTVAHELGHNFGIQHDGNGNDCEPIGKRPFIMSPQLLYGTFAPSWSRCSRQYISRFLDRGWGWCLDDPPVRDELSQHNLLPGALYSALHQCQLQYGADSLLCDDVDNVCSTLWCTVGNTCHSKLDGAVDGTKCGEGKWCFGGECVPVGNQPKKVDGGWESWGTWSDCSRTCGAGVKSAQRDCSSPAPRHGGKYCLGERRRYKVCNTAPCPPKQPSFRLIQCNNFNTMPYKGRFYHWVNVNNRVNPCELHCRPLNESFSEKLLDAVVDGTQCYEGSESRDICINGICKNVGCDFEIDSHAVEDRCGVCLGNGSTCETVRKTFEETEGLGYVDIGLIPAGARDIRIEEVAEAGNFLALRSNDPGKYFLNGGWTIQWNGDYKAAGTVFTYERTGHLENLTSPGPTQEPVWIQLLFQETNPGVRYEYTISRDSMPQANSTHPVADFQWQYGSWTECSATCGTGVQRQTVHCVERTSGIVEAHYCDPASRPDDKRASCNEELCPAIWWVGEWQRCSVSCGASGLARRTVICIQSVGLEEQRALQPSACQHLERPPSIGPCNTHVPCPATWVTGNWSECSTSCAGGLKSREVTCSWDTGIDCDHSQKPGTVTPCFIQNCPTTADGLGEDWSGSGSSSKEVFNEINSIPDDNSLPPHEPGITKPLPKANGNGNNPQEDDFIYSNFIDNPSDHWLKNNVQVDDFYYDYNFINFHEDLFHDDDAEEKESKVQDNTGTLEPTRRGTVQSEFYTSPTTSAILTSRSEDFHTSSTPSPSLEDDGVTQMYHNSENEENPLIKISDKNVEDQGDIWLSEDDLLPISVTTSPKQMTPFPEQWEDLMENIATTEESKELPINTDIPVVPSTDLMTVIPSSQQSIDWNVPRSDPTLKSWYEDDDLNTPRANSDSSLVTQPSNIHGYGESVSSHNNNHKELEGDYEGEPVWDNWPQFQETDGASIHDSRGTPSSPSMHTTSFPGRESQWLELTTHLISPDDGLPHQLPFAGISTTPVSTTALSKSTHKAMTSTGPSDQEPRGPVALPGTEAVPPTSPTDPTLIQSSTASIYDYDYELWPTTTIQDTTSSNADSDLISSIPVVKLSSSSEKSHEVDYNEILVPPSLLLEGTDLSTQESPLLSPQSVKTQASTATAVTGLPPTLPAGRNPLHPTIPAQWQTGNWSSCSTTCGLGAVWRIVRCSSGVDTDCDPRNKPVPAHRCYLRPCSAWRVRDWSQCSRNCGGGEKLREVHCLDMRDQRALRPFHCQAVSPRPPGRVSCNIHPCLNWHASSWGQCSELCGGGDQQRLVTCQEQGRCDESFRPKSIQACNSHPCSQWVTGSWGQCSASCGGGVQRRLVKCVNAKAEQEPEAEAQCDHAPAPEDTQTCNHQECVSTPAVCLRDRLTFRFCQTLSWLGRCHLATVRAQCCKTCAHQSLAADKTAHR